MPATNRPFRIRHVIAAIALIAAIGLPVDHVAAAQVTGGGFTSDAVASRATVRRGRSVTITIPVTASTDRSALVDVEIYDAAGRKAFQQAWDDQTFDAGIVRTYTATWTVPAGEPTGTHRVDVGVFSSGWGQLYHWNRGATTLLVATGATTTTTTVAPTTTDAPTTTQPPATTDAPTTTQPPTTTAAPTTSAVPTGHFVTLPPNSPLPGDAECAARVRFAPEVRSHNVTQNDTRGVAGRSSDRLYARVTGDFVGTTDQIIQWAACKWGFDEDIVRAQSAVESYWDQRAGGDLTSDPNSCPPGHGIGVDGHPGQCPDSWGLQQVRFTTFRWAFPASSTISPITSTAYNLDIALAARRLCYEGSETWLNTVERGRDYAAGDLWGCVGMWFSGRWYTQPSVNYINVVKSYLDPPIWTTGNFLSYG
jgi:hypothetical protein